MKQNHNIESLAYAIVAEATQNQLQKS